MMGVKTLLKLPFIRHILHGIVILLIGFFLGFKVVQKRLNKQKTEIEILKGQRQELKGKSEQQEKANAYLKSRIDTLQVAIYLIAKKPQISVNNTISGTKLKDGSELKFVPDVHANIHQVKQGVKPDSIKPKTDTLKVKSRNFFKRLFKRKKTND